MTEITRKELPKRGARRKPRVTDEQLYEILIEVESEFDGIGDEQMHALLTEVYYRYRPLRCVRR